MLSCDSSCWLCKKQVFSQRGSFQFVYTGSSNVNGDTIEIIEPNDEPASAHTKSSRNQKQTGPVSK